MVASGMRRAVASLLLGVMAVLCAGAAHGAGLRQRLTPAVIEKVFPGAEDVGADEGIPPALPVRIGGQLAGYLFSTRDTVNATGYSGTAFEIVGGITLDGRITGAVLLEEHESILNRGVSRAVIDHFVAGFAVATLRDWAALRPDQVKGATTSARLMKSGMQSAARAVAQGHLPAPPVTAPTLDRNRFDVTATPELRASGAVVHASVTVAQMIGAFETAGGAGAVPDLRGNDGDATFLDVDLALLTPPGIGVNVVGQQRYNEAMDRQEQNGLTIWIAVEGTYTRAGTGRSLLPTGFFFDAVQIVQGGRQIAVRPGMVRGLRAGGANELDERDAAVLFLPAAAGLDPLLPWQAVILIAGRSANGGVLTVPYSIEYRLPASYVLRPAPIVEPQAEWIEVWRHRSADLVLLGALLAAVTSVFLFQDALVRYRRLYAVTRVCLLGATVVWLGWTAGGQLSIVNVMAYVQAPFTGTPLSAFLLDPILFVVAVYVALSLLVLGRGVYCGWLCPFGALQELSNRAARLLRVPQIRVPAAVQERLWAMKYLLALVLVGLVFFSVGASDAVAEVEPFKTVVSARLAREWPYVLYALALLGIGLFVERFYCRFLCPLGGALAVMGRVRMLAWLKRRPQCGSECRICEAECPIGAIHPSGTINMNECLQCLDCQVAYYDDSLCPPLLRRRTLRSQREAYRPVRM